MAATAIGIRELKARLSSYLRRVKAGETIVITERGTPIGRIVPTSAALDARAREMVEAGLAEWSGRRPTLEPPAAHSRGPRQVSELVIEDRR